MNTVRKTGHWFVMLLMLGGLAAGAGCLDSSSKSKDKAPAEEEQAPAAEGEKTRPIVAYGDSITTGAAAPGVTPYPARVAGIKGTSVLNRGINGQSSCAAANGADGPLSSKPTVFLVLVGTNDVLAGHKLDVSKECIRTIIRKARSAGATPIIATIPPIIGDYAELMPDVNYLNGLIRDLAAEERVKLVDLARQFGSGEGLMMPDGFHPNETGTQLIAFAFAEAF
jgi:acyl-CoA thioesterase I